MEKILWMHFSRSYRKQHSECEVRRMNPKLGQQWASPDAERKKFIVQWPWLYKSVGKLLTLIDKCGVYWWGKTAKLYIFVTCLWVLLLKAYLVSYVIGRPILNNPWVWYSQNILPMIKMRNRTITQRGTETTGLGVMIGKCSLDGQHEGSSCHPTNIGCSFFQIHKRRPK